MTTLAFSSAHIPSGTITKNTNAWETATSYLYIVGLIFGGEDSLWSKWEASNVRHCCGWLHYKNCRPLNHATKKTLVFFIDYCFCVMTFGISSQYWVCTCTVLLYLTSHQLDPQPLPVLQTTSKENHLIERLAWSEVSYQFIQLRLC